MSFNRGDIVYWPKGDPKDAKIFIMVSYDEDDCPSIDYTTIFAGLVIKSIDKTEGHELGAYSTGWSTSVFEKLDKLLYEQVIASLTKLESKL